MHPTHTQEFEAALKKRRKEFGEVLEKYAAEVESYHTKSEMHRKDQIAAEVRPRWFCSVCGCLYVGACVLPRGRVTVRGLGATRHGQIAILET